MKVLGRFAHLEYVWPTMLALVSSFTPLLLNKPDWWWLVWVGVLVALGVPWIVAAVLHMPDTCRICMDGLECPMRRERFIIASRMYHIEWLKWLVLMGLAGWVALQFVLRDPAVSAIGQIFAVPQILFYWYVFQCHVGRCTGCWRPRSDDGPGDDDDDDGDGGSRGPRPGPRDPRPRPRRGQRPPSRPQGGRRDRISTRPRAHAAR